ncbi:MAG: hypothetical protein Q9159_002820 [Coniocarpon cinnabarinum]
MSARHLYYSAEGLVVKGLRGAASYNTDLRVIEDTRVTYDTTHNQDNVAIISGGGAGHEPAWGGYVGHNMLAAAASGDIFASPSTKQVLSAIEAVPSSKGHILIVGNYTGDCLHFGLACEKANAMNKAPCGIVIAGDDVSVGKKGSMVGRRGLAGQVGILKIVGAASAAGGSFDDLMALSGALCKAMVSIASTIDHAHVPGRSEHAMLASDEIELGTGPHNEPGYRKLAPVPSPEEFLAMNLKYMLDETDPERGYVKRQPGDTIVLMVSNFGGMSNLEQGALVDELLNQLERDYKISPVRIYSGCIETSLNAPAFSTSILNLSAATREGIKFNIPQMIEYLDVRTSTQWEGMQGRQLTRLQQRESQFVKKAKVEEPRAVDASRDLKVDAALLEKMLRSAATAVNAKEPELTKWDTVMGDGDCGETLKTGGTSMLQALDGGLAKDGSVVKVLYELEHVVESKMGGTLGGILGIFVVSLTSALQKGIAAGKRDVELWAQAVNAALSNLQRYTAARAGDRTVMDVLIPFAAGLSKGSFATAVDDAVAAAEGTKKLTPRLGRATYVGVQEGQDLPPDPGAWGIMEALRGLYAGSKS